MTRLNNLGLYPRMALAISGGFLVLLVAFAFLGEQALQDSRNRLLEERLVIAQMAATQIDGIIEERIQELKQTYRFSEFDLAVMKASADAEKYAYTRLQEDSITTGIIFLDRNGNSILLHPPEIYPPGIDLLQLPFVADAFSTKVATVSEPSSTKDGERKLVSIAVPITDGNGAGGLLIGVMDLENPAILVTLQHAATLGISGHASLVNRSGLSIASTYPIPFLSPGEHHTFYREAMATGKQVIEVVPVEFDLPGEDQFERHVMAFVPLQLAPWGVAVGGDEHETFAGVTRLRTGMLVLGSLAFASVWAGTLIGSRRLLKPVKELTYAAEKIASGNLNTPLHITQEGEIGALAVALENMRVQLLTNIKELAGWNESLEMRVKKKTVALRMKQAIIRQLFRNTIDAQEEERARIARELHDDIGQILTAAQLTIDRLERNQKDNHHSEDELVSHLRVLTDQAFGNLRRVIAAMRPGVLDELGLVPALEWVVDQTLRPINLPTQIDANGLIGRLPGEIETVLFRIAQEAINNVARHSHATRLTIQLHQNNRSVTMMIADDGCGFDPGPGKLGANSRRGLGLASMRERALLAGGQLLIESSPNQGTILKAIIPLPEISLLERAIMRPAIRLVVADDHTIVREGLVTLLEDEPDLLVVGQASTGEEALALIQSLQPDVILLDIKMPDMTGLNVTALIATNHPKVKILILTMHEEEAFFFEALRMGAAGYILKGARSGELINAIRAVYEKGIYLSPNLAGVLVKDYLSHHPSEQLDNPLTPREREVLQLIARGFTNSMIAQKLSLSINTVKTHRLRIYQKLNLDNRTSLIAYAIHQNLINA